jgi:hypothetical protein
MGDSTIETRDGRALTFREWGIGRVSRCSTSTARQAVCCMDPTSTTDVDDLDFFSGMDS